MDKVHTHNIPTHPFIDADRLFLDLAELPPVERIKAATQLIELCRDRLMVDLATVRRTAASEARHDLKMRPRDIAVQSDSSPQTINRLLAEAASAMYSGSYERVQENRDAA